MEKKSHPSIHNTVKLIASITFLNKEIFWLLMFLGYPFYALFLLLGAIDPVISFVVYSISNLVCIVLIFQIWKHATCKKNMTQTSEPLPIIIVLFNMFQLGYLFFVYEFDRIPYDIPICGLFGIVIFLIVIRGDFRSIKSMWWITLVFVLYPSLILYNMFYSINLISSSPPSRQIEALVTDKKIHESNFPLFMATAEIDGKQTEISMTAPLYEKTQKQDTLVINIKKGLLGVPYYKKMYTRYDVLTVKHVHTD